jgi:hypothetical protein
MDSIGIERNLFFNHVNSLRPSKMPIKGNSSIRKKKQNYIKKIFFLRIKICSWFNSSN